MTTPMEESLEREREREREEKMREKECSLCGDIGFSKELLPCRKCGFRFQHTYCSRLYPNIQPETWRCEWCIHEEEKQQHKTIHKTNIGNNPKVFEFLIEIAQSLPSQQQRQGVAAAKGGEEKPRTPRGGSKGVDQQRSSASLRGPSSSRGFSPSSATGHLRKQQQRWRKQLNCNSSSSSKVIGRRYKLLADVLC
ncbi:uncharacterized protein LOC18427434 [Amborella trichopoda]|nr:uncharacterized protein LOC18427434 [Amborella trichopoda]|eukprot:XP_006836547.3 uncharacterized protein LOC18427434 [Amborella trichopoda]